MSDVNCEPVSNVYLGHDNAVTVVPYSDITERTVYDMSVVTEVQASLDLLSSVSEGDDITASSNDAPITVWWEQVDVGTPDEEWRIHMKAGLFVGVTPGDYKLRIVLFDPPHTNGLVLTDSVQVTVVAVP